MIGLAILILCGFTRGQEYGPTNADLVFSNRHGNATNFALSQFILCVENTRVRYNYTISNNGYVVISPYDNREMNVDISGTGYAARRCVDRAIRRAHVSMESDLRDVKEAQSGIRELTRGELWSILQHDLSIPRDVW